MPAWFILSEWFEAEEGLGLSRRYALDNAQSHLPKYRSSISERTELLIGVGHDRKLWSMRTLEARDRTTRHWNQGVETQICACCPLPPIPA